MNAVFVVIVVAHVMGTPIELFGYHAYSTAARCERALVELQIQTRLRPTTTLRCSPTYLDE